MNFASSKKLIDSQLTMIQRQRYPKPSLYLTQGLRTLKNFLYFFKVQYFQLFPVVNPLVKIKIVKSKLNHYN